MDQLPTFKSPPPSTPSLGSVVLISTVACLLTLVLCFTPIGRKILLTADNAGADLITRLGTQLKPAPEIVLIEIDRIPRESDTPELAPFTGTPPFSRAVLAQAIRRLHAAGAQTVGITAPISRPSLQYPEGDHELAVTAAEHQQFAYFSAEVGPFPQSTLFAGHPVLAVPDEAIIPLTPDAADLGVMTLPPDRNDGVVRLILHSFPVIDTQAQPGDHPERHIWLSMAARLAGSKIALENITSETHRIRWTHSPKGAGYAPFQPYRLSDLFDPITWQDKFDNGTFFNGKKVLITPAHHSVHNTPLGPTSPAQIQLCSLNALLAGERGIITELPTEWEHAPLITGVLVALVLFCLIRNPAYRTGAALLAAIVLLGLVWILFNRSNQLVPWSGMLFALGCVSAVGIVTDMTAQRAARRTMIQSLSRQTSPKLIRKVRRRPSPYRESLAGTRRPMPLLTVNLKDFAEVVEPRTPGQSVTQLNKYLEHINHCIFDNDGITSTSPGDSILASWGSLDAEPPASSAPRALDAARQIRHELDELNSYWMRRKFPPLKQGIGLHVGECIIGEIGPHNQRQLNIVGRTASTVRQIEALTHKFSSEIILSESMRSLLPEDVQPLMRPLPFIQIHGNPEALTLFDVLRSEKVDHWLTYKDDYLAGLKSFNDGDFESAVRHFDRCRSASPTDGLVTTMLEGAQGFVTRPPRKWKGVISLDKH
ncbi:adenylate/guanylate cyclase domain-containing protein [Sulfuriroseicoccus oceanibius]|uniref:Adenylate/guanylate cyclase domain-containing protein n=1 Tax=Sulfuriroseicoccus oceanibius TaxID=2707525 RepID=A0A6B3L477_9BACT|nr:adenylate/guanylate cyclase domain-containing protein [Sulfuriroseicoccus oceanibius]QQL45534.1 adenylate/guanylate cyclase domain-containing protein [Sulfuriroseicoccus oceanibius]